MTYRTENFSNTADMDFFLNGGIAGGRVVVFADNKGKVFGLDGLTLVINATTVTFTDATGAGLLLADIKTEIESTVAGVTVKWLKGKLALEHATSVTVASTGTANSIFGFSDTTDAVGTPFGTPGSTAPAIVAISASPTGDSISVLLEVS